MSAVLLGTQYSATDIIKVRLNYLIATPLLLSFLGNLILGYLFVSRGLLYAMALNFLFSMKYAVVLWAM